MAFAASSFSHSLIISAGTSKSYFKSYKIKLRLNALTLEFMNFNASCYLSNLMTAVLSSSLLLMFLMFPYVLKNVVNFSFLFNVFGMFLRYRQFFLSLCIEGKLFGFIKLGSTTGFVSLDGGLP